MNYKLTTPCPECPFLKGSGFKLRSLKAHASGEFACHKACDVNEETGCFESGGEKSPHCAGALIFHMKRGTSTQMMRIANRLGMFDPSKLNMQAEVQ